MYLKQKQRSYFWQSWNNIKHMALDKHMIPVVAHEDIKKKFFLKQ